MILEDVIKFLQESPPFHLFDKAALRGIAGSLSMQFYPRDSVILNQGGPAAEAIWIIKKGGVKALMKSEQGEEVIMDYLGVGDNFGFLSLIGKERQRTTVITIDDTICYVLGRGEVLNLIETNPQFAEYFLSYLSRYVERVYREMHTKSLLYSSADSLLYTTKAGDMAKAIVSAPEETTIQEAAGIMARGNVSSLIIFDRRNLPVGIVTDRDLREKVIAKGRDILEPVRNIMTISLIRIDAEDSCFEAVLKMIKYKIHHLLIIKEGSLHGIMTNHDLMLLQGASPLSLAKNIENQQSIEGLVAASGRIYNLVGLLLKGGATAGGILTVVTEINDRLIRKALEIAERQYGHPPVPYCWIVFGSEGRKEQLFKTDQDNAIVYQDPETVEEEDEAKSYFSRLALFVRDSLVKVGYPLCSSDYMAGNPHWCQPLSIWKGYFSNWISDPSPDSVARSLTFFDFRPVHGKFDLADALRDSFIFNLQGTDFLRCMAGIILRNKPPIGFFKSVMVEKNGEHRDKFDLKQKGTIPIVDMMRFLAIAEGIKKTSTIGRLNALKIRD
ncbi:MAG: DUF294 nucleotidyltransferase-like domain-containing protein, partial [Smithellaceae bacterium]|nr:DUF294 nucleotidyltransferase-like domain-containing protein [Smithellaceae bacterium]